MIVARALFREAALTSLAIIVVLLVLMVFVGMTQALGQAAIGQQAAVMVFQLMGLEIVRAIDTLLPLAMFIGVLLALSRWYRDSEMVALQACGTSLAQLMRPVMALALLFLVVVGLSSLVFSPLAARQIERVKQQGSQQVAVDGIQPGVFNETGDGQVFYVEATGGKHGALRKVFLVRPPLAGRSDYVPKVVVAERGTRHVDKRTGSDVLILDHGRLYEGVPGSADYRVLDFARYRLRVEWPQNDVETTSIEAIPTLQLDHNDPKQLAEFHWRLARPVALPVLALLALVLAHTEVRRGRAGNLFAAILVFFIYTNVLGIGAGLLKRGELPAAAGLWWIHAGFAAVALYFLYRRLRHQPLLPLPRWAQ